MFPGLAACLLDSSGEYELLVENDTDRARGKKPVIMPLGTPQISHGLT
jgi:hypothetical protein